MPEHSPELGYAAGAEQYWQQGWRGVLPLPPRKKWEPPKGFTGKSGLDPSYPDVLAWADLYPSGNLCLRLPDGIIGIDVDAYGAKTGAQTFAEAQRLWGRLPDTVRTTSRDDGISGIRLYRIPASVQLITKIGFTQLGIGDIEIVQRRHRYAIAWPSTHPEGATYWWRNHHDQLVGIPTPDDIPTLPDRWIDALASADTGNGTPVDIGGFTLKSVLTTGEPSDRVAARLRQAIKELNTPGATRHDVACGHVLAITRLGKTGEPGVDRALHALGEMFVALVSSDRAGGRDEAVSEFKNMLTGDGLLRELARPSATEWTRNIIIIDEPDASVQVDENKPSSDVVDEPYSHLADIERGFWDARDSLAAVYTTAMSRMSSPWAVLAHTAARALTLVRPCITLPPLIGGPGSLNWFSAVTAASGGGKGSAAAAARLLIPQRVESRGLGSGEGLLAVFGQSADDDDPTPLHEAFMFTADEVDTVTALSQRTGNTMMAILRSGFSGETLSLSYAAKDKRRHIEAHTYRMTLVISVQPERAGSLLGDAGGGTPQRFMWFPGTDNRITANPPWEAGALTLPKATEWISRRELTIPDEARELILTERVKAMRGESDALDGHALFVREKFAYALTVLDGRVTMTSEDWELSGIAADISTYTRTLVADALKDAAGREAEARGEVRGIELHASDLSRDHQRIAQGQRVLRWALDKLEKADDKTLSNRELWRAVASRDRGALESALTAAVAEGLVKRHPETGDWIKL